MTSLRFEYSTAQDSKLFQQMVDAEDRRRRQFVQRLPQAVQQRWRGWDGEEEEMPIVEHLSAPQASVHLFSKKMKRVEPLTTVDGEPATVLPPVTHLSVANKLVMEDTGRPTAAKYPSEAYIKTKGDIGPADSLGLPRGARNAIPKPPATGSTNAAATKQLKDAASGQRRLSSPCSSVTTTSIFSRGSSSAVAPHRSKRSESSEKPKVEETSESSATLSYPKTPSSKVTEQGSKRSFRTSSTQREKLRTLNDRLSRMEQQITDNISEEANVSKTIEELKGLVLQLASDKLTPK